MSKRLPFMRRYALNIEGIQLLEYFLIAAVTSLLAIRAYLNATGFPQIGGGDLHIAHMLWGGLFMLVAQIIFMMYLNRSTKTVAAILGGIGFGTFIDELGKFITTDNDYFYEPTIAVIYVIFILLFLLIRYIASIQDYTDEIYLANAVESLRDSATDDLDTHEHTQAQEYLKKISHKTKLSQLLSSYLKEEKPHDKNMNFFEKTLKSGWNLFREQLRRKWVAKTLVAYFILSTVFQFLLADMIVGFRIELTSMQILYLLSLVINGIFVGIGVWWYVRKQHMKSYKNLLRSVYISIFLVQFFVFLEDQLSAITSLGLYIVVYLILKEIIFQRSHAE